MLNYMIVITGQALSHNTTANGLVKCLCFSRMQHAKGFETWNGIKNR